MHISGTTVAIVQIASHAVEPDYNTATCEPVVTGLYI